MKKTCFSLLLVLILLLSLGLSAYANSAELNSTVKFNGKKLVSDYSTADIYDAVGALQPGDDITIKVSVRNNYSQSTDWWMNNTIINSFETSSSASGGAYTYELSFSGPSGTKTFYSSDRVGGDIEPTGLKEATDTLEDFFYLDTLKAGQKGTVTLYIKLEGETQGNAYQSKQANLEMNFATELTAKKGSVNTDDEFNFLPYILVSSVSGLILLAAAIIRTKKDERKEEGQA